MNKRTSVGMVTPFSRSPLNDYRLDEGGPVELDTRADTGQERLPVRETGRGDVLGCHPDRLEQCDLDVVDSSRLGAGHDFPELRVNPVRLNRAALQRLLDVARLLEHLVPEI